MVVHVETDRGGTGRKSSEICLEQASQLAKQKIVDSHRVSPNKTFSSSRKLRRLSNGQLIMIHRWLQHPVSHRPGPIRRRNVEG
ncbi:hypothetical protein PgNI_05919 [Pyricularia grisea]|uniref:Uncharacterized protein n=1 Tax=Pyricularia grisea TaxID=148305 RepID=A0A6P8B6Y7_PYRGI|nr:hypothetical protein PgNI_05919 [Pyricularia grisea]TLD11035.1 hypothetical protein PgNI_05919 [Pyricularia grisea]